MKKAIKVILFIVVVGFVILGSKTILERKESLNKDGAFYSQKEDFDVLFFGSSHMLNGGAPMELWNDYGIVSYNLAHDSEYMAGSYWDFMNALQYTTPKLVVVDMFLLSIDSKVGYDDEDGLSYVHKIFDGMPFSMTKVQAARDLLKKPSEQMEVLFDLSLYHERWNDLEQGDFKSQFTTEKGGQLRKGVMSQPAPTVVPDDTYTAYESTSVTYLRKMIAECKKRNIDILLVNLPYPGQESDQLPSNYASAIAKEYGIQYLNLIGVDGLVNYQTDMYDHGHLNPSGARKATDYIGQYIIKQYNIPDHKKDSTYITWNDDYRQYEQMKIESLLKTTDIEEYLMLLDDDSFSCTITINGCSDFLENSVVCNELQNLGATKDLAQINAGEEDYLLVYDGKAGKTYESVSENAVSIDTSFGNVAYSKNENEMQHIKLLNTEYDFDGNYNLMKISVVCNYTKQVVDTITFYEDQTGFR